MKIKAVCEETGLTDRAVRYYIDEGLIRPEFTENYIGRRSYDFRLKTYPCFLISPPCVNSDSPFRRSRISLSTPPDPRR